MLLFDFEMLKDVMTYPELQAQVEKAVIDSAELQDCISRRSLSNDSLYPFDEAS